jgi:hypothetical protein
LGVAPGREVIVFGGFARQAKIEGFKSARNAGAI